MSQVLAAHIDFDQSPSEQRSENRRCLSLQVAGSVEENQNFNATVRDLSRVGFLMDSTTTMTTGEMIYVELPRVGRVSAQVAWTEGRLAGCRFLDPISSGALSAALLRSLPEPTPLLSVGPAGQFAPRADDELSPQHKMIILLGLSVLAWAIVLGLGYAGLQLFNS
jgi:hypothetical protein